MDIQEAKQTIREMTGHAVGACGAESRFYDAADMAIDALALMQKQEQGLVVELPCRVGDTVYAHVPEFMRIGKFQVDMVRLYGHKNIDFEANWAEHGELMADLDFEPNDIGKTVFLTRAEAENAIAND